MNHCGVGEGQILILLNVQDMIKCAGQNIPNSTIKYLYLSLSLDIDNIIHSDMAKSKRNVFLMLYISSLSSLKNNISEGVG